MIQFIIGLWTAYRARILIGMAIVAAVLLVYHSGVESGKRKCSDAQAVAIQKDIKTHGKIEHEVAQLPDSDLDKRLSRWMRD